MCLKYDRHCSDEIFSCILLLSRRMYHGSHSAEHSSTENEIPYKAFLLNMVLFVSVASILYL